MSDQNHLSENVPVFFCTQIPLVYIERAGFMTRTSASHKGELHYSERLRDTGLVCDTTSTKQKN